MIVNMVHNNSSSSIRQSALAALLWVTTLMSADMQRGLAKRRLTEARAHLLWELGNTERLTQRELAQALNVTPRNITALIDALEGAGFVERTEHPTDRRAVVVVLTEKGNRTVSQLRSDMAAFATRLFGNVSDADVRAFSRIVSEIGAKLSEIADHDARRTR